MKKFNELHFFIDESGKLSGKSPMKDILLVGGLLMFGPYDADADAELHQVITRELSKVGGRFPEDLHFSQSSLSRHNNEIFLKGLSNSIKKWAADERTLYGVYIKHAKDIFNVAPMILAEKELDNRYLSMLWSLVEYLVFVDDNVRKRLAEEATVNLHIASRIFTFDKKEYTEKKDELESLGYDLRKARWRKGLYFAQSLKQRELTTMVRMALRQRWNNSNLNFGAIDTSSIQYSLEKYNHFKPPMALYLADLFLGQARSSFYPKKAKLKQMLFSPPFRTIQYGPWLESLAQMQADLESGDIDSFFTAAEAFYSHSDDIISAFSIITGILTKKAVQLLEKKPDKLRYLMQGLAGKVDLPGRADSHSNFVHWCGKLIQRTAAADRVIQALHLQCRLSICNHTGDVQGANQVWQKFLEIELELFSFGSEGLRVRSEMRNRRAVSLTDSFQYREAESILLDIISLQQDTLLNLAKAFSIDINDIPNEELGACYGTLGQIYAFMGTNESFELAEKSFRHALGLFKSPADINRQWVYLGHLACDQGEDGNDLWHEVLTNLPDLRSRKPISGKDRQFEFALQIKGLNVFGSIEDKKDFCEMLEKTTADSNKTQNDFSSHPYGLIYQGLGILYQSLWDENKENPYYKKSTATFYDGASKLMKDKPGLLNILGLAAQLRKEIFEAENTSNNDEANTTTSRLFTEFKNALISLYSDGVWKKNGYGKSEGHFGKLDPGAEYGWVERANAVLSGIRFNYW